MNSSARDAPITVKEKNLSWPSASKLRINTLLKKVLMPLWRGKCWKEIMPTTAKNVKRKLIQ